MNWRRADGTVLVVVLASLFLVAACAAALALATASEVRVADSFHRSVEVLYAADLAAERALADLALLPSWDDVLGGVVRSAVADGLPFGARATPAGSSLDLSQVLNLANCRKTSACGDADMDLVTSERPWGRNNPRWQPFAYGPLSSWAPGTDATLPYYMVVLVGDDPAETDQDPFHDGEVDGAATLAVRSEAFGPRGAHRIVELVVARMATGHLRIVTWCALR
jgi:hypothetical protein